MERISVAILYFTVIGLAVGWPVLSIMLGTCAGFFWWMSHTTDEPESERTYLSKI